MGSVFTPGMRVVCRDAEWLTSRVDAAGTNQYRIVFSTGVDDLDRGYEAAFLTQLDQIKVVNPRETALVRDELNDYICSWLFLEAQLRHIPLTDPAPNFEEMGAFTPIEYQKDAIHRALKQMRPRLLMADKVSLGKTKEVGMVLSELIRSGRCNRNLVLAMPAAAELEIDANFDHDKFEQVIDPMCIATEEQYLTVVRSGRKPLRRKQRKAFWKVFVEVRRQLARRNLLTFDGLIHRAREVLVRGEFPRYRHVLVDEIQDFSLEALRLVASISPIAEKLDNPLCVVGDGHQRIYNPIPVPLGRAGIEVRGRSRRLKINYRTSEEIRDWAHAALEGVQVDDLDGEQAMTQGDRSIFHGPKPQLVTCKDDEEVASAVVSWVKGLTENGQFKTHEICLTPVNSRVISALQSHGFATVELKARQADPGQEESGVRFGSKKRIKGLEFKAVAILDNGDSDSLLDRFENYVAATRARQQLLVINRPAIEQSESEGIS